MGEREEGGRGKTQTPGGMDACRRPRVSRRTVPALSSPSPAGYLGGVPSILALGLRVPRLPSGGTPALPLGVLTSIGRRHHPHPSSVLFHRLVSTPLQPLRLL